MLKKIPGDSSVAPQFPSVFVCHGVFYIFLFVLILFPHL
uniref:Uncharacterized protein n=1 Tax=Anguilla anguilla TaxID=7936 RepID=A0A0E9XH75_ANGAN